MEAPYGGRATLNDTFGGLEISIPVRRNNFIVAFLGVWLTGWLLGECFAISAVTGLLAMQGPAPFLLLWLVGWTVGGLFAFRVFLYNLIGKEIITIGQGELTVNRRGVLFSKPKTYNLADAKSFRVQDDGDGDNSIWGMRNNFWMMKTTGTLRFDYGMQTVKFASGIDEAEGKFILNNLRERKILTDKNFSTS